MTAALARPSLARQYAEPIEVHRRDDRPARFVWRRRRYVVHAVLEHWVTTGTWWNVATASADEGSTDASMGVATGPGPLDDEREFWRIEAAADDVAVPAVVDLCFRWSTGEWTVQRLFD